MTRADRARRLCAEVENCFADARDIHLHVVADAIELARRALINLALARLKIDLKRPRSSSDPCASRSPSGRAPPVRGWSATFAPPHSFSRLFQEAGWSWRPAAPSSGPSWDLDTMPVRMPP